MNKKYFLIIYLMFISLKCLHGQKKIDDCVQSINESRKLINNFYKKSNKQDLILVIDNSKKALFCDETKIQGTQLIVQSYILLDSLNLCINFIDNVDSSNFRYSYQKKFYFEYINLKIIQDSLLYKSKFDNLLYWMFKNFDKKSNSNDLSKNLVYDIFLLNKSYKFQDKPNLNICNKLLRSHPELADFIGALGAEEKSSKVFE